jgi:preprotein translocase subunit SecD
MESAPGPEGTTQTVSLLRADPVSVTVETEALLTEANILAAGVLDAPAGSGFAVEIEFDDIGTLIMEQYSAANPGKHFVIFGQWGEKKEDGRWLAAPLITRRINNGIISFTPDMSRDDAYRFVLGLNNFSKKMHEGQSK